MKVKKMIETKEDPKLNVRFDQMYKKSWYITILIFVIYKVESMEKRVEAAITKKQKVNHDCYIFSYQFLDEKIQFSIGQYFKIIKTLPTTDHPEGEELQKKYTPINPCSQTVNNFSDRILSIFLWRSTGQTPILCSLKEENILLSLRLKK